MCPCSISDLILIKSSSLIILMLQIFFYIVIPLKITIKWPQKQLTLLLSNHPGLPCQAKHLAVSHSTKSATSPLPLDPPLSPLSFHNNCLYIIITTQNHKKWSQYYQTLLSMNRQGLPCQAKHQAVSHSTKISYQILLFLDCLSTIIPHGWS